MLYPEFPAESYLDLPAAERSAPGVADLLDYDRPLSDTILRHKAGAMIAGFDFLGPSHEAHEDEELDVAEEQLVQALGDFKTGWVIHLDLARFRTASYPCMLSTENLLVRRLEAIRRERFESEAGFGSQSTLWFACFSRSRALTAAQVEGFEARLDAFVAKAGESNRLRRLNLASMVSRIHAALRAQAPKSISVHPDAFLDTLVAPSLERLSSSALRVGDRFAVPLRLTTLPKRLHSGVISPLSIARLPFRLTTRFVMLSPADAEAAIGAVKRQRETAQFSWRALLRSITRGKREARSEGERERARGDVPDENHLRARILETNQALEASFEGEAFVYFATSLLVAGRTEAEALDNAGRALAVLRAARLDADSDRYNEVQAYLGAAPGNAWSNLRRSLQPLRAALALQPLTSTWSGHDDAPHPELRGQGPLAVVRGTDGATFRLNLHPATDDLADLGHTLVIGPSGAGKSVLLNFLAASARRYSSSRVISLDVDRSQMVHCLAAGGAFYDLRDGHLSFAPLFRLREGSYEARSATLNWLMTLWDATHAEPLGDQDAEHLADAVEEVLRLDPDLHSIEVLAAKAQSPRLRRLFARYTASGEHAQLFAGRHSQFEASDYTVIELRGLLGLRSEATTPAFSHLLELIATMLDGRPGWVLIDEGFHVLTNPILAKGIHDWLITARKRNAAVVFATQSLSHLADPSLRQIMDESCPTRIFLPNAAAAANAGVRANYQAAGLSERQIDRIATAIPKRHYLLMQPGQERMIDLALSPAELAVLGSSSPKAIKRVMTLRELEPDGWLEHWIQESTTPKESPNEST